MKVYPFLVKLIISVARIISDIYFKLNFMKSNYIETNTNYTNLLSDIVATTEFVIASITPAACGLPHKIQNNLLALLTPSPASITYI